MIEVTRLNGEKFLVNPHQIEFIEKTPDTVISLVSGRKIMVKDDVADLTGRIVKYRRSLVDAGPQEF
ncbi:flagellar FlbD family protein [bacterium]|nr:flagellar FlbD family protein [bacterium]